jgi:hypothetical protein
LIITFLPTRQLNVELHADEKPGRLLALASQTVKSPLLGTLTK